MKFKKTISYEESSFNDYDRDDTEMGENKSDITTSLHTSVDSYELESEYVRK
jgi:hypothetical protein